MRDATITSGSATPQSTRNLISSIVSPSKLDKRGGEQKLKKNPNLIFPHRVKSFPVGMFEVCFGKRPQYIYKVAHGSVEKDEKGVKALFIRMNNWKKLICSSPEIQDLFLKYKNTQVLNHYLDWIYFPMRDVQLSVLKRDVGMKK